MKYKQGVKEQPQTNTCSLLMGQNTIAKNQELHFSSQGFGQKMMCYERNGWSQSNKPEPPTILFTLPDTK